MTATTRDRALDAAIELLGTEGVRALTHARVDAAAGLPAGSTSNWFRTRRALLAGCVDHLAEQERADFDASAVTAPATLTPDEFIDGLCRVFDVETGPLAARTRARYSLWLELGSDPELGAPLRRQRLEFERWTESLLGAIGMPNPATATKTVMALGDGLVLHRLAVDPGLDPRPLIERAIRSLMIDAESAPGRASTES
ncbi:TetR/AcrR family transcriptional regulator [Agromyces sp. NPDC058136]|uniref:TetR/AcrR family transcriptional regulator n=1 Tax=Agromyces sp. NPDC058136 TaxID=3346354 RepID=UPI0036DBD3E0